MEILKGIMIKIIILIFLFVNTNAQIKDECAKLANQDIDEEILINLAKYSVPALNGTRKGDSGKIGVFGGSIEYSGAPFFSAITSLKMGADLVYVITTDEASPIIKSYSPDLIVYPFLHNTHMEVINNLLTKMNLVIIGPGLGRTDDTIRLAVEIIKSCKKLHIPLVIDADGLYAVSKNPEVLSNYLRPGVILTPNLKELERLMNEIGVNNAAGLIEYWGPFINIIVKGQNDSFTSFYSHYNWEGSFGGSGRRAGGQGDILAGILGTFFNWALRINMCHNETSDNIAASVSAYVAAKMTRICNEESFKVNGRGMLASDMLNNINFAFRKLLDDL